MTDNTTTAGSISTPPTNASRFIRPTAIPRRPTPSQRQRSLFGSSQFKRVGLPFLAFMVLGSFGMSRMMSGKFDLDREREYHARLEQELNNENATDIVERSKDSETHRKPAPTATAANMHVNTKSSKSAAASKPVFDLAGELSKFDQSLQWHKGYDIKRVPTTPSIEEAEEMYREERKRLMREKEAERQARWQADEQKSAER